MEKEIIHIALEKLEKATGWTTNWMVSNLYDGLLIIDTGDLKIDFTAWIKREVRKHHLTEIEYLGETQKPIILAEYILPVVKERLREMGIAYLERTGNAFIKTPGVYCFIDTNKRTYKQEKQKNRAFTKTGLKVLFQLLLDTTLVNQTHREIAKTADVALGNIPLIIKGLQEAGYLLQKNNKEYLWENRKGLIDRWVDEYATTLRPGLVKEKYKYPGNWKQIKLKPTTLWGGEPAADLFTQYLRPEIFILYTQEGRNELMKNYRFIPDKSGQYEVLDLFYMPDRVPETSIAQTVPPLLVYTDLMIEGGKRNTETAQKIYDEYIR